MDLTRAPRRFAPRTSNLTGLIVCLAHHDGGSTLVTDGVCAKPETQNKKIIPTGKLTFSFVCKMLVCLPQRRNGATSIRCFVFSLRRCAVAGEIFSLSARVP